MINTQKYTLSGNAQGEKHIRELLNRITEEVVSKVPQASIRALILLGGYGKGEGGLSIKNDHYVPHNNFDLLLVTKDLTRKKAMVLDAIQKRRMAKLSKELEISIDISVMTEKQLLEMPTRVLWYDMKKGHRTLYGDDHFIPSISHRKQDIPPWDMRNLMVNRGSLLLINLVCLQKKNRTEQLDRLIVKHTMKAIIGYGDSLLYFLNQYHWSYAEKHKRILKHPAIELRFKRLYDDAIAFRTMPKYEFYLDKDLKKWHRDIVKQLEQVHLKCEAIRLGAPELTWANYLESGLRTSLSERGFSWREIARKAINLLRPKKGLLPRSHPISNKLAYHLADPETLLPLVFPYIAFNPTISENKHALVAFLTTHFDKQPSETLPNVIKAYLKDWGEAFDRNLQSVLMKNKIAL